MRKICISNAGTHGHTHQFSQSGQSRSRSWPITQCPIAWTWESTPKQWAVMAIIEDRSPTFETVLRGLIGCIYFISVGKKKHFEWLLWHWSSLGQWVAKCQLTSWRSVSKKPRRWVFIIERRNSIANALELRLSCTNPSICNGHIWLDRVDKSRGICFNIWSAVVSSDVILKLNDFFFINYFTNRPLKFRCLSNTA